MTKFVCVFVVGGVYLFIFMKLENKSIRATEKGLVIKTWIH